MTAEGSRRKHRLSDKVSTLDPLLPILFPLVGLNGARVNLDDLVIGVGEVRENIVHVEVDSADHCVLTQM